MTVEQKTILTSFPGLTLPDGRRCMDLDRFDLARALVALGVSGVDAGTGIADSLRLYSASEFARPVQDTQAETA